MKRRKKYTEPQDLDLFTVWVGGVEANDYYLTGQEVVELVIKLANEGHDDIAVEKVLNG